MKTADLITEATSLPVEERVRLVDALLRSLNPTETDIDRKWASVAKQRLQTLRSGETHTIPGNEVFEKIWNRLSV